MNKKALGRGLEALIPSATTDPAPVVPFREETAPRGSATTATLDRIRPNPYQPRKEFDAGALEELAQSIRENGLLQPLLVRAVEDGGYELIAGERRFQASRKAGLHEVPIVVREATRRQMLEIALVENIQREDLNPIEEADAYQRLATEFGMTQEAIAERVGKSRSAVTNALRLLGLEDDIKERIASGALSAGHARALLAIPDPRERRKVVASILEQGMSVRDVEAQTQKKPKRSRPAAKKRSHPALEAWEARLRDHFGTQVRIVGGLGRGRLEVQYFSEDDLERILELTGAGSSL